MDSRESGFNHRRRQVQMGLLSVGNPASNLTRSPPESFEGYAEDVG